MAGAVPLVEYGVLTGRGGAGLEVCRVVDDPHTGDVRLEVGIGAHDREAFQMMHGNRPTVEALADVVQYGGRVSPPGRHARHPLNLLAQERAVRARLMADPGLIGATSLAAAQPPLPRPNLKDPVPCVARAVVDGAEVTVVCSVGVDLDAVPYAVDARAAVGAQRCLLVLPLATPCSSSWRPWHRRRWRWCRQPRADGALGRSCGRPGFVERLIRGGEQTWEVAPFGHPDGDRDLQPWRQVFPRPAANTLAGRRTQYCGRTKGAVGEHGDELVAPEANDRGLGAGHIGQQPGDAAQHIVAEHMAEGVVDPFEVVDVRGNHDA